MNIQLTLHDDTQNKEILSIGKNDLKTIQEAVHFIEEAQAEANSLLTNIVKQLELEKPLKKIKSNKKEASSEEEGDEDDD